MANGDLLSDPDTPTNTPQTPTHSNRNVPQPLRGREQYDLSQRSTLEDKYPLRRPRVSGGAISNTEAMQHVFHDLLMPHGVEQVCT